MFEIYLNTRDVLVWYQCWSLAEEGYLANIFVSVHPRFQVIPTLIITLTFIFKKKKEKRKKEKGSNISIHVTLLHDFYSK